MSRFSPRFWSALALAILAAAPASAAKHRKPAAAPPLAEATIPPPPPAVSDADFKADAIQRVSAALNAITTLKAEFTQVDAKGISNGRFYLARPGRLRFEYDPPARILIIADGSKVTVRDLKVRTEYRAKIGETPLRLLLKPDVDLAKDATITEVAHDGNHLAITAVETKGYGQGQITFVFDEGSLQLQRWIVVDPTGAQTTVTLQNIEKGPQFAEDTFKLPEWTRSFGQNGYH